MLKLKFFKDDHMFVYNCIYIDTINILNWVSNMY